MSKSTFRLCVWGLVPWALALAVTLGTVPAQERGAGNAPAAKAEKKEKLTGRLPPYYGQVVSKEQREKIYAVQAKYAEQLEKLQAQLESLEKVQKEEIEAVLSPEQREQVAKMISDARSKRSKKTEPSGATESESSK